MKVESLSEAPSAAIDEHMRHTQERRVNAEAALDETKKRPAFEGCDLVGYVSSITARGHGGVTVNFFVPDEFVDDAFPLAHAIGIPLEASFKVWAAYLAEEAS
jgi:hypothetical protein